MTEKDPDDDKTLFHHEMAEVRPLKSDNRISHKPKRLSANSHNLNKENQHASDVSEQFSDFPLEECPEILQFARNGVQKSLFKKLRSGKISLENHLDLHGRTVAQARLDLLEFITECEMMGCRCALVIHGKGYSSPNNKPVIKAYVNRWLREAPSVLAFSSALVSDGGSGAAYVLFKRRP